MTIRECMNPLVVDTETTGLNPHRDEVLSVSIIDNMGQILFDRRFGTIRNQHWDAAQAVHGIAPTDVAGLEPLNAWCSHISKILKTADTLVGYNLEFDLAFFEAASIAVPKNIPHIDVMHEFAHLHGLHTSRHPHGKWTTLASCARHYGYTFTAHSSLEDARATLYCFNCIRKETPSRHM